MHLLLVHLKNESLVRETVCRLRQEQPQLLDRALLAELVVGLPYLSVRRDRRELVFLQHLPVTCLQPWHQLSENIGANPRFTPQSCAPKLTRYCSEDLLHPRSLKQSKR